MNQAGGLNPGQWLGKHGDVLFRYALVRLGDRDQAEDLVQETFAAALKGQTTYSGWASERTWLVGILKHKILDYHRKAYREPRAADLSSDEDNDSWIDRLFHSNQHWREPPATWQNPRSALQEQEFWSVLQQCLRSLSKRLAAVFSLRVLDGLPGEEIRNNLGISETNLGVMLYRARLRMRQCLETEES